MAVAGMVLGILAIVFSFIPLVGIFLAIPCGGVGLILSAVALARRKEGQGKGMALAGLILSIVAIVLSIIFAVIIYAVVDSAVDSLNDLSTDSDGVIRDLTDSLSNEGGRAYMNRQPCIDVMAEYDAMKLVGHDTAVMHVSSVYNAKAGFSTYVAVSDAASRVRDCS